MPATKMDVQAALARSDWRLAQRLADSVGARASVSLILAGGGDMRIWPDPVTGRNRYGTLTKPAPDEISFSSTTASNISPEGFAAAGRALGRLFGAASEPTVGPDQWFDEIRDTIVALLGLSGAEAILAASGTDAEVLTLGLAAGLAAGPITNIFIAPDETGNGVPLAAAGRHFSNLTALGETVTAGSPIEGFFPDRIDVRTIAIRDEAGRPRDPAAMDREAAVMVEQELRRGRDVLLHVLDASKTGLMAVTRQTARGLAAAAPGRVRVVIDACQLRSPLAQLQRDLADGFMVTVTGSKFAGGPPFSGALLLPAAIAEEVAARGSFAAGLSDYSAALDWPAALRYRLGFSFKSEANIGLGLRWIAALDGIASLASVNEPQQGLIIDHFARLVRERAAGVKTLALHPDDADEYLASRSIVPLTVLSGDGAFAPLSEAQRVQLALRDHVDGPICHIGQAVRVGPRNVLRVGASARDVSGVAARMANGQSLEEAFQPIEADLDAIFAKWSRILDRARAE
jgi:hypothetical protein